MAVKYYVLSRRAAFEHSTRGTINIGAGVLFPADDTETQDFIEGLPTWQRIDLTAMNGLPERVDELDLVVEAFGDGFPPYETLADLPASPETPWAAVWNDSTESNRGRYFHDGSSWAKTLLQPASKAELATKAGLDHAIVGSGLATGGGDGTANRVIDVPEATEDEARGLENSTGAVTPRRIPLSVKELLRTAFGIAENSFQEFVEISSLDGFLLFQIADDGTGSLFDLGLSLAESPWSEETADGFVVREFNEDNGAYAGGLDAQRFEHSLPFMPVVDPGGCISHVTVSDGFVQYHRDGMRMMSRFTQDTFSPLLLDGPWFEIIETDGRSWVVRRSNLADECTVGDPSGRTAEAVKRLGRALYTRQRAASQNNTVEGQPWMKRSTSDNVDISEFYRADWSKEWSFGDIVAALVDLRREEFHLKRPQIIHLSCGEGGQTPDKFLPEGASFTDGSTTVPAALVDGNTHFLWEANVKLRSQVGDILRDSYQGRSAVYRYLLAVMSPETSVDLEAAFLAEYRAQQDGLGLGVRDIFWVPNVEQVDSPKLSEGAQALVEFCSTNTSGHDWLAAAGHPYPLDDRIHRTSWGNVALAEVVALAMVYLDRFGDWAPPQFDKSSVSISGNELSVTITNPRQTVGSLQVESERMPLRADLGINLLDRGNSNAELVSSVSATGNVVTVVATEALAGKSLGFYYAALPAPGYDYANAPDGTVETPQYSSCFGKLFYEGIDPPIVLNEPTVKHFVPATIFEISA